MLDGCSPFLGGLDPDSFSAFGGMCVAGFSPGIAPVKRGKKGMR